MKIALLVLVTILSSGCAVKRAVHHTAVWMYCDVHKSDGTCAFWAIGKNKSAYCPGLNCSTWPMQ